MVYTVTFNPAIDYVIGVDALEQGMTNRSSFARLLPGGKGLNVSIVLNNMGIENTALGFIAGFTGAEIRRSFEEMGGRSDFIELKDGISRINVKIKSERETEINAEGPVIDGTAMAELTRKLDAMRDGDTLVLAGSIPPSLPNSLYGDIMKMLSGRDIVVAVDAAKDLLLNALPYKPFLIKPNNKELGEIFGTAVNTREEVIPYAKRLRAMGAKNVLTSLAGDGAVLVTETDEIIMREAPKGRVISSVGAGDSMLAGFIAGWRGVKTTKKRLKRDWPRAAQARFPLTSRQGLKQRLYIIYFNSK